MMIWTLQGTTPRTRSMPGVFAGIVAMFAMALLLNGVSAEAAVPTRQKPAKARHSVALQSYPAKHGVKKATGVRAASERSYSARPGVKKPGAKKSGERASDRASSRAAEKAVPRGKMRGRKQRHDDPPADEPTMYCVRGRRGGGRASVLMVGGRAREYTRSVVVIGPAPLRGTHEILVHQNLMADEAGLERIQDDSDLDRLRANRDLVDFEDSRQLRINPELPYDRRCARPWTVQFAIDTATAFYAKFGHPLEVTSAARSVSYQMRLQTMNGNAAGTDGDAASPHLTGQAIDLAKRGMSRAELAWMRNRLVPLIQAGKIDVEEEFKQACFHISVYRSYMPMLPKRNLAQLQPTVPTMRTAEPGSIVTAPEP